VVQPNLPIEHVQSLGVVGAREDLFDYTKQLLTMINPPDVIAWPEVPLFFSPKNNPDDIEALDVLLKDAATPLLVNADMFTNETVYGRVPFYNTVQMLQGSSEVKAEYRKNILIPLGEFLPLERFVATPETERFLSGFRGYVHGEDVTLFGVPSKHGEVKVGTPVCVEIQHSHLVAKMIHQGAEFLVNPANDAYFGHVAASRFGTAFAKIRSVEFGVPVVRVTNSGESGLILPTGRVAERSTLKEFERSSLVVEVPLAKEIARAGARGIGSLILVSVILIGVLSGMRKGARL
jgi:apolipoprotein N-acyltransferase